MRLLPVLAVLFLATACQAAPAAPTAAGPSLVAVPTAEPPGPNAGCMDALLTGVLVADEDVGVAVEAADGTRIVVVWPHGWAAVDADGSRTILNDRAEPIARVGDEVGIGGGHGQDGRFYTCGEVTPAAP
jgi:hypothetical protein